MLGPLRRPGVGGGLVRRLRGERVDACPRAVDDRVAGNGVEPRRARAALGPIGACGPPDGRKRLLNRFFGATSVTEPAKCEPEHGTGVAAIEGLERPTVAVADATEQLAVALESEL